MTSLRTLAAIGLGTLGVLATGAALALPFTPVIDEFWIVKGTAAAGPTEIFRDSFSDGFLPPSGPDDGVYNPTTYATVGAGGFTSESVSKLTMTPASGAPIGISGTFAEYSTVATRLLATNPVNPNFLGVGSSFEIHGLFDMVNLPTISGESFGIRATDRATTIGNEGNDTYVLFVGFGAEGTPNAGNVVVALRHEDFVANLSTVLASISIESLLAGADQIELIFSKGLGADVLTASYRIFDINEVELASNSIGDNKVLSVYNGETYIRGGFQSTDIVPVPEPATLALLGLGFTGLLFARKRKTTT